jgi:hypothetical protein
VLVVKVSWLLQVVPQYLKVLVLAQDIVLEGLLVDLVPKLLLQQRLRLVD